MARLFDIGKKKRVQNITLLFLRESPEENTVFFTVGVPKRNIPLAVDRNRLKRQLREAVYSYSNWNKKANKKGLLMFFFNGRVPDKSENIHHNVHTLLDAYFSMSR